MDTIISFQPDARTVDCSASIPPDPSTTSVFTGAGAGAGAVVGNSVAIFCVLCGRTNLRRRRCGSVAQTRQERRNIRVAVKAATASIQTVPMSAYAGQQVRGRSNSKAVRREVGENSIYRLHNNKCGMIGICYMSCEAFCFGNIWIRSPLHAV